MNRPYGFEIILSKARYSMQNNLCGDFRVSVAPENWREYLWNCPQTFPIMPEIKKRGSEYPVLLSYICVKVLKGVWGKLSQKFSPQKHLHNYLPKYLSKRPANARPWRASSFAISWTVSWIASRLYSFAIFARSNLPAVAPFSASTRTVRFFSVES